MWTVSDRRYLSHPSASTSPCPLRDSETETWGRLCDVVVKNYSMRRILAADFDQCQIILGGASEYPRLVLLTANP